MISLLQRVRTRDQMKKAQPKLLPPLNPSEAKSSVVLNSAE